MITAKDRKSEPINNAAAPAILSTNDKIRNQQYRWQRFLFPDRFKTAMIMALKTSSIKVIKAYPKEPPLLPLVFHTDNPYCLFFLVI